MSNRSVGLNIIIAGDAKGASGAFRQVRGEVTGLDSAVSKAKTTVRDLFLAYQSGKGLIDAATAASSLGEATATSNQVFREGAGTVQEYAKTTTDSLGISERAALSASNAYGGLLTAMGLNRAEAADWSTQLVTLAADLSAFWDTSREDALTALRSGLSGEMEPLKRYGVLLTDVRLREEARNLGIYQGTGILNANQKAQAALSLIMKDTADAQGQAAREADGWTQRNARLSASIDDAKVKLGQGLLPIMQAGTTVGIAFADVWGKIPGQVQVGALAIGGAVYLLPRLVSGFKSAAFAAGMFQLGLAGVTEKGAGASNALGGLISTVGPTGVAAGVAGLGLLAVAVTQIQVDSARAKQNVKELQEQITNGSTPAEAAAEKLANTLAGLDGGFSGVGGSSEDFRKDLDRLGVSATQAARLISGPAEEWDAWVGKTRKQDPVNSGVLIRNLQRMRDETTKATDKARSQKEIMAELGGATDAATDAAIGNTDATKEQTSAYERAIAAVEKARDRQLKKIESARALEDAERATADALREYLEVQATAEGRSDEVREARERVTDSLEREADAAQAVRDANRRLTDAQADYNEALRTAEERLKAKAVAAREAADAEAGALVAADRARKELERARSGGADELTIREKEQAVREADTAIVAARQDARTAAREDAEARRLGVAGDEEVVRAKEAVADANRGVADAARQVRDAEEATADAQQAVQKVISDAKAKIAEAYRKVEDAAIAEVSAAGDAATAQYGAAAGAKAHADRLRDLIPLLAPGSDLRRNLEDTADLLERLYPRIGRTGTPASAQPGGGSTGTIGYTGDLTKESGRTLNVTSNVVVQGTSAQQRRGIRQANDELLGEVARAGG